MQKELQEVFSKRCKGGKFIRTIFLVPKKEGLKVAGKKPVINLKDFDKFLVSRKGQESFTSSDANASDWAQH